MKKIERLPACAPTPGVYFDIPELCTVKRTDLDALEAELEKKSDTCEWDGEYSCDCNYYETSCNHNFTFIDGGISDNNFKYCPYCGKEIEEIIPQEQEDEGCWI
jgi:uncharacterized Zn-finger protein